MAIKKKTINHLYTELQILKDIHDKEIGDLRKIIKHQDERIEDMERLVESYRQSMIGIKKKQNVPDSEPDIWISSKEDNNMFKCETYGESFTTICDLELHIKKIHKMYKEPECGQCAKNFVTTWRLRKHLRIHTQKFTKVCHFFMTGKPCPFEELGCKFLHSTAQKLTVESENETVKDTLCDSVHIENIDSESITDENKESNQKNSTFYTSTPKKWQFKCTSCDGISTEGECDECFVDEYIQNLHKDKKKHFLMDDGL